MAAARGVLAIVAGLLSTLRLGAEVASKPAAARLAGPAGKVEAGEAEGSAGNVAMGKATPSPLATVVRTESGRVGSSGLRAGSVWAEGGAGAKAALADERLAAFPTLRAGDGAQNRLGRELKPLRKQAVQLTALQLVHGGLKVA